MKTGAVQPAALVDGFVLRDDSQGINIILGGCHVAGQSLGKGVSFPARLQAAGAPLANSECIALGGVSMRIAVRKLRPLLADHKVSRVILQVGHRETIRATRLTLPWRRQQPTDSNSPESASTTRLSFLGYVKSLLIGVALYWLGFDRMATSDARFSSKFTQDAEQLLALLKTSGVEHICVLSCFPTAKDRLNRKRVLANAILERTAGVLDVPFVDVWGKLSFRSGPLRGYARPGVLSTGAHLNAEGHRIVAEALAPVLALAHPAPRSFAPIR